MKFLEVGNGSLMYPLIINLHDLVSVSSDKMEVLEIHLRGRGLSGPNERIRFKYPTKVSLDNEYYRISKALLLD